MRQYPAWFWAVGLIAAALAVGFVLPFDRYVTLLMAALALAAVPFALVPQVRRPGWGLALLVVVSVLVPLEVVTGDPDMPRAGGAISAAAPLAAFVCAAWVLRLANQPGRVVLDHSWLVVATLVFMFVSILSFLVGQFPWFRVSPAPIRAQIGGLGLFLISGGIVLVVGHEVRSIAQLKRLTWLFLAASAAAMALMLSPGTEVFLGRIAVSTYASVGSLFFTWLVAMSISQAIWNDELSPLRRAALVALGASVLVRGLLLTFDWASGWLPPLIALGVLLFWRFPRLTLAGGLLLAVPVLLLSGMAWDSLMDHESWSWLTRLEAFRVMMRVVERSPLLGLGPANYSYYTPLFPILGYRSRFNSHNNYVDLLAQTGVIGFAAFCWIAFEALRMAYRLQARLPRGFGLAYAHGALAGLAGSLAAGLLADWIVPYVYNIGLIGFRSSVFFWLFLGGLLALRRLVDAASAPSPATASVRTRDLALNQA